MQKIKILVAILLSTFTLSAYADQSIPELRTFQYWVRIPKTDKSCDEEARLLADRFALSSGLQVVDWKCRGTVEAPYENTKTPLYSLILSYRAEFAPYMYKAVYGYMDFVTTPSNTVGTYEKYSSCIADLPKQIENYEKETTLKAVAAYCQPAGFGNSFLLNVEGVGYPKRQLYIMHSTMKGSLTADFENSINTLLLKLDAHVVLKVDSHYFYYKDSTVNIRQNFFGMYSNPAECDAQIAEASNIYKNANSKYQAVKCLPWGGKIVLNGIADGYDLFSNALDTEYFSFSECMQDKERVMQSGSAYNPISGAICVEGRKKGQYSMETYRR